jgi:hypothetical protein
MTVRKFLDAVVCDLIGHSMDPMESDYIRCTCDRCNKTFLSECPRDDLWFWLTWYNAKAYIPARWRDFVFYIRPCDECGRRFCKRPLDDEHIPF